MKLLRHGARGAEKPGMLASDGTIRDLSGVVADISGSEALVQAYAVNQAPTLIITNGDNVERYCDIGAIKQYIEAKQA